MAIVEFLTTENEVHLTNNVYSQVAHRRFLVGDAARTQKKSEKSEIFFNLCREISPHCLRKRTQGSSFRQYIDAGINPVVPAFPMVPTFQSF